MDKKNVIMCRCEDVDLETIHDYLQQGFVTFEDLKRLTRVGMGACQGSTCLHLIRQEIASFTMQPLEKVAGHRIRPFISGVKLKDLSGQEND